MAKSDEFEIEFKRQYIKLFTKADKLRFNPRCLIYSDDDDPGENDIKDQQTEKNSKLFYFLAGFIILLFSRLFLNGDLHFHHISSSIAEAITFAAGFLNISQQSLKGSQCAVQLPYFLTNLMSPPANCSMCRGLRTIEKIKNLSKERFERLYAYSGRPVIVTDAMLNWTAREKFGFEFFAELYNNSGSDASRNCQFFPYQTKYQNLMEVFNSGPNTDRTFFSSEPWYIGWGNCDSDVAEVLREHYSTPYFLPEGSQLSGIDWIFMGSPGYGAHMHIDRVGNPSWQAQLRGMKLWTLEPPSECYFECQPYIKVVVKTGEMIVLDTDQWHHSTLIIGDETSITIGSEYD